MYSIGFDARQSEGGNAPLPPSGDPADYGGTYVGSSRTQLLDGTRSYGVSVFNKETGSWMWHRTYDVYESGDADNDGTVDGIEAAGRMANDLNNLPEDGDIVVFVTTQDEPQTHRLSNGLESAMYGIGASSSVFGASDFKYRSAYLLIGSPALSQGEAYVEEYKGSVDRSPHAWVKEIYTLKYRP